MVERLTAPVAGCYHVVSGRTPHLEDECDEACMLNPNYQAKSGGGRTTGWIRPGSNATPFATAAAEMRRLLGETLHAITRMSNRANPEPAETGPRLEASGCEHLCSYGPAHDCAGEPDGEPATDPSGHQIRLCAPCRTAADYVWPSTARHALDAGLAAREASWPSQGSTCSHVCGPDPDHECAVRADTNLKYDLPSGGTRLMPLCGPCHAAEIRTEQQSDEPEVAR